MRYTHAVYARGIRMRIGLGLQLGQGVPLSSICHRRVSLKHPEKSYTVHRLDTRDTREPSVYSRKSGCRYPLPVRFHDAWAIISQCAVHALANDVFQDLPGRWCLLICVMSGRFEELLDRLLLEWRAARQAGENVFLAWRARKTLCTPRRKDCGYLYDADKDLDVLAIFSLFVLGRKGVADFPPLAYARNRKWTHSPFLRSLCSTTALFVRRQQDENRVLDLAFARKRTDWQLNGRSIAVLWMIDLFNKTTKKKKRNYRIWRGRGGGGRNLWLPHCRSREHAVRNRSLLAIWLDKDWGNPDRNVVAQILCCWWMCGFAWWIWFPTKNHHWTETE